MMAELGASKKEEKWSLNEEKVQERIQKIDALMGAEEL